MEQPKTVTIQIGNSDNELSQHEWSKFIQDTREAVGTHCGQVHFDGGSSFDSRWQNVCIVAELYEADEENLVKELVKVRQKWRQFAVAFTLGQTRMV